MQALDVRLAEHGIDLRPYPRVVCVIPALNEERFIGSVTLIAKEYADDVIVIDDGSSDRTGFIAEHAGARVVRHNTNLGKAAGLNDAFSAALDLGASVVVCLDGDAQHDPAEIPQLILPILHGDADVVVGSRFLGEKSETPGWRQVGQQAMNLVTNTASGTHVSDTQSGYRAFSRNAAEAMYFTSEGLAVESEMQFLFGPAGLRVAEVPIHVQYRDGNKRNPVKHGLQVIDGILKMVARRRPLLFIALPGLVLAFLGVLLGTWVTHRLGDTGELPVGSAIVTVLLIMCGALMASTGVTLHSMDHFTRRIADEIRQSLERRRPLS